MRVPSEACISGAPGIEAELMSTALLGSPSPNPGLALSRAKSTICLSRVAAAVSAQRPSGPFFPHMTRAIGTVAEGIARRDAAAG
jgi:hypothetical protein